MRRKPAQIGLAGLGLLACGSAGAIQLGLNLGPASTVSLAAPALAPCPAPSAPLELALWKHTQPSERPLACHNRYVGHFRFPHTAQNPAFSVIAAEIAAARGEVLITNLEWEIHPTSPTQNILDGVANLYRRVKANPAGYPQGMRVRLHTGVIPTLNMRRDSMDQPIGLRQELLRRGVPMQDAGVNWDLKLGAFRYFPHSHAKFHVIDGRTLSTGGYNITRWFNAATPDLKQSDLNWGAGIVDERLTLEGPLALSGVWAFDDLWRKSDVWQCTPQGCKAVATGTETHPDYAALAGAWPQGEAGYSFSLYERAGLTRTQDALLALMNAARDTMDLNQATYSASMICTFGQYYPDGCGPDTWPAYFAAIPQAMQRGVKIRLLLTRVDGEVAGNMATAYLLNQWAKAHHLIHLLEIRWNTGRHHNKTLLVDRNLPTPVMVSGSINWHFSSWGPYTLAEHSIASSNAQAVAEARRYFEQQWAIGELDKDQPWNSPTTKGRAGGG